MRQRRTPRHSGAGCRRPPVARTHMSDSPDYIEARDGARLFLLDWGEGAPVVFVHGFTLNADVWEQQMLHLSERGHRCIAYDRRGHGRSEKVWSGYDFDTLADDLADVLD